MQLPKPQTSSPRATRNKKVNPAELLQAMVLGDEPRFDSLTGADLEVSRVCECFYGAKAGLEAPRFCQLRGHRMVVQVCSDGWIAECSRYGEVDSVMLEQR